MTRCPLVLTLALAAALAGAAPARGGLPNALNSTIPPVIAWCPAGDDTFLVIARDFGNNIWAEAGTMAIDLSTSPGVTLCPTAGSDPYSWNSTTRLVVSPIISTGYLTLPVRASGGSPSGSAIVLIEGMYFAGLPVVSPDQNGDGVVDAQDLALLQAKVGTTDLSGDLDGDGHVTAADVAILEHHLGHMCTGATPARYSTWGRVKSLYR